MGYYTTYQITCSDPGQTDEAIDWLVERTGMSRDHFNGNLPAKWYNYNEDMVALSLTRPGLTYRLEGHGEDTGDVWVAWYRDGQTQGWQLDVQVPQGFTPPGGWV